MEHKKVKLFFGKSVILMMALVLAGPLCVQAETENPAMQQAQVSGQLRFEIAAQSLADTLMAFSEASDLQLLYDASLTRGLKSKGISGDYTPRQALNILLEGSGLTAHFTAAGTVTLARASAVESGTITTLPEIRVVAEMPEETAHGPVDGYVARRSATASKTDTPIIEIPQSISVIGREEMNARGVIDVQEAIRYTPGVAVNIWGVENRGREFIMMRGFRGNESYRDGLRVGADPITETYGLERIEVLRGPASVMFGQGEPGGIINRISKQPTGETYREVALQYGSFNRQQLAFDVGDRLTDDGRLAFRFVGLGLKTNSNNATYSNGEEIKNDRLYFAPSLRWRPTAATSLTVLGEVFKNSAGQDGFTTAAPDGQPTTLTEGDPNFSLVKKMRASIGYLFEHQINDAWIVKQNFRQTFNKSDDRSFNFRWEDDERTLSRTTQYFGERENRTLVDTQLHGKLHLGITEHTVLFGIDWSRLKYGLKWLTGPAPSFDRFIRPVDYGIVLEPTDPRDDSTTTTQQLGFYAQDQIKIDQRWVVTLGGRYDRVKSTREDRLDDTNSSTDQPGVFSPRVGLSYLLDNGWAPYVSYAESFLHNEGVDADGQPFVPTLGKQTEVGIKYQPENTRISFTAAVFDLRKSNVITYDPDNDWEARQIGIIRSRGIELEAKAELMSGLNATAAYTRFDLEVLKSTSAAEQGKTPRQVPEQIASVWLDYAFTGGFSLGSGVRYVGSNWNDNSNTSSVPGYTLADVALRYDLRSWQFALNATNLLDKEYVASRAFGRYFEGARRNVVLSMKYNW